MTQAAAQFSRAGFWVTCCLAATFPALTQSPPHLYDAPTEQAVRRGNEAIAAKKYEDAIRAFKEANKLQRNACFDCYLGLAVAYRETGDAKNSEESANKALAVAGDAGQRAIAHSVKGSVLMLREANDPKKLAAAEQEFRQALVEQNGDLRARFQLGWILLKEKRDQEGIQELKAFIASAPPGLRADAAAKFIADPRRARESFAPEFEMITMQGEKVALNHLLGKVVVLDFWATWCPPCRDSLPELKDLVKKYPREKLVLISISADAEEKKWREFIAKKNMDWPQYLDSDLRLRIMFGVRSFPTYVVIDREVIIREEIHGMNPQQSVAYRLRDTLKSMRELD